MVYKVFSRFLFFNFFLMTSLVFGAPYSVGTSEGESPFPVSPKRYSQRLFLKRLRKQSGGVTKISKRDLFERKPLSFLSDGRNVLDGISSVEFTAAPKEKVLVLKDSLDIGGGMTIPGSISKLSEDARIEKLFLKEIEIAGGGQN